LFGAEQTCDVGLEQLLCSEGLIGELADFGQFEIGFGFAIAFDCGEVFKEGKGFGCLMAFEEEFGKFVLSQMVIGGNFDLFSIGCDCPVEVVLLG